MTRPPMVTAGRSSGGNEQLTDTPVPGVFRRAVASLDEVTSRPEIVLEPLTAPRRLAPFAHALSATVYSPDGDEIGSGRLVLLHDPDGVEAWDGTLRIVVFLTCELESEVATDPLLPEVAWSWLVEALDAVPTEHIGAEPQPGDGAAPGVIPEAGYTALGGTVTCTTSTRFGDISGPVHADDLEMRASWTPRSPDCAPHLGAFVELLTTATGLPPEGVASIRVAHRPNAQ